jgi:hypothetical protein
MKRSVLFTSLIVVACVAFVALFSFLPLTTPPGRFNSPDEVANGYFSALFARTGTLWSFQATAIPAHGLVHPRSTRIVDVFLVPGSFLGLPVLFGLAGKVFGTAAIPFMTPVLAVLAALAWGALVGSRLGRRVGIIAGALLLVQPAWWYASSRTMMPNVAFCAFVIFAAAFFFVAPFRAMLERSGADGHRLLRGSDAVFAGIFFGLALAVRTSETYWLALAIVVLLIACRKQLPWTRLVAFLIAAAFAFAPFLIMNDVTFGDIFATGYGTGVAAGVSAATGGMGGALLGPLRPILFPLGFAPRIALANVWTYGIAFFWWWSLIVIAALVFLFTRRASLPNDRKGEAVAAVSVAVVVSIWLILFYGSWIAPDETSLTTAGIGASYFRYWLPIAVLSTVPVAWALGVMTEKFRGKRAARVTFAVIVVIAAASGASVFLSPGDGLLAIRDTVRHYDVVAKDVVAATPADAIIITDHEDKYFFPDRAVMTPLRSDATYASLSKLKRVAPLFYFGITLPPGDFAYLRDVKLAPAGLTVNVVKTIGAETLYSFAPLTTK